MPSSVLACPTKQWGRRGETPALSYYLIALCGSLLAFGVEKQRRLRTVMSCQSEELRCELVEMAALDLEVRDSLIRRGVLNNGYHPEMEAIHVRNASRLKEILAEYGWPTPALVGDDGAESAWLIVQHAIGDPPFQRLCLRLLQGAGHAGEVPLWQAAMLEDRIRMFEGKPQIYGTQLEPDSEGTLRPYLLEDPEHVDERRSDVGLEPLSKRLAREQPSTKPADPERFEREYQAWLRRVGWRS